MRERESKGDKGPHERAKARGLEHAEREREGDRAIGRVSETMNGCLASTVDTV